MRPRTVFFATSMLVLAGHGCARSPTSPPAAKRPAPPLSPRETIARLVQVRAAGDYDRMQPLIVPERAADVISALIAIDSFLRANEQLCERVSREVGAGLAQSVDQSHLAYNLEVFSKHVELLEDSVTGQTATVAFVVDGQLPAQSAKLVLRDGIWRYDPGPGDYDRLSQAFQRMARGLREVSDQIRAGRLTPQALRRSPELLHKEVEIRLRPGQKLLPPAPATGPDPGK